MNRGSLGIRELNVRFGSWHFELHGDLHRTVQTMGTSIAKLDKNYANKAAVVIKEQAMGWFAILPLEGTNILPFAAVAEITAVASGAAANVDAPQLPAAVAG
jgi:hypothetical protein